MIQFTAVVLFLIFMFLMVLGVIKFVNASHKIKNKPEMSEELQQILLNDKIKSMKEKEAETENEDAN